MPPPLPRSPKMFALDPRLAADTIAITRLDLCRVLLMNEPAWPWLILVPEVPDAREIIDLDSTQRGVLMDDIAHASRCLQELYRPLKLNVAALGNQVPQLHVHVIARHAGDPAWPNPVWGQMPRGAYEARVLGSVIDQLRAWFDRD